MVGRTVREPGLVIYDEPRHARPQGSMAVLERLGVFAPDGPGAPWRDRHAVAGGGQRTERRVYACDARDDDPRRHPRAVSVRRARQARGGPAVRLDEFCEIGVPLATVQQRFFCTLYHLMRL